MARPSSPPREDPTPAPSSGRAEPPASAAAALPPPPASRPVVPPPVIPPPPPSLFQSMEAPAAASASSVERVAAKESFAPDEPLPAFTFPVIDEAQKQELLRRVEEGRAASAPAPIPPPPSPAAMPQSSARRVSATLLSEPGRIGRSAWAKASKIVSRCVDSGCAFIDRNRSRLPARLRDPLSKVSTGLILAIVSTLAVSILLGGFLLIRSVRAEKQPSSPEHALAPMPAPEDPVPREIEQAKKEGHAALEKLTERFPKDARVWLELAASSSAKGDHAAAVSAVGKALAADPKASDQALASDVLALAVRKRETMGAAFELLQGSMGAAGAAALYDLSIDPKVALTLRAKAEEWVRSEAFKKVADADVEIAGALRYAKSCSDRHELLPRAAEKGGRRVLDYLNLAKVPGGCGRNGSKDCFPCLRKDAALKDAISEIEKRLAGK